MKQFRKQNDSRNRYALVQRVGIALPLLLVTAVSAWAQSVSSDVNVALARKQNVPAALLRLESDAQIMRQGMVQGDTVLPFSTLGVTPNGRYQPATSSRTHFVISRRSAYSTCKASALKGNGGSHPNAGTGPGGLYVPADIIRAYGVPANSGYGTIAIIDAYDYPTAMQDFNEFSRQFGLPQETSPIATLSINKVFQVVYANGHKPNNNLAASGNVQGWNEEAALDIEWAHAMAPKAKIVLVETNSNNDYDLIYAGNLKANSMPNVKEVSMSFGHGENWTEANYDSYFTHPGTVYFASTGDTGGVIEYPSCSPNVVGVGGTSLITDSSQNWVSESGWGGSGGGISQYEALPSYQQGLTLNGTAVTKRSVPDVSLVADPGTGVYIYWNGSGRGVGGTSVSAPTLAGIVNARGSFYSSTNAQLTALYSTFHSANDYKANFHDVTAGTAGSYNTFVGYDLVTGIGTPNGVGGL